MKSLLESASEVLKTNGGPIDSDSTTDGKSYVMVERTAFESLEAAVKANEVNQMVARFLIAHRNTHRNWIESFVECKAITADFNYHPLYPFIQPVDEYSIYNSITKTLKNNRMKTFDKESVYDTQIYPLMAQIIEICKANGMPMIASVVYRVDENSEANGVDCATTHLPDGNGEFEKHYKDALTVIKDGASVVPRIQAFTITTKKGV